MDSNYILHKWIKININRLYFGTYKPHDSYTHFVPAGRLNKQITMMWRFVKPAQVKFGSTGPAAAEEFAKKASTVFFLLQSRIHEQCPGSLLSLCSCFFWMQSSEQQLEVLPRRSTAAAAASCCARSSTSTYFLCSSKWRTGSPLDVDYRHIFPLAL